jgi:NADH dehydrogenase FAD-containing subunit
MNLTAFWYIELVSNRTDLLKHFVRTIVTEKKNSLDRMFVSLMLYTKLTACSPKIIS